MKSCLYIFLFHILLIKNVYCQQARVDSIITLIEDTPLDTEERFYQIMSLAKLYQKYRHPIKEELGYQEYFLDYGKQAIAWAEKHGSSKQLAGARLLEFRYHLFYKLRKDKSNSNFYTIGQQMINKGLFASEADEYFVYSTLIEFYSAYGFYHESLALLPRKYELGRSLGKPSSGFANEYGEVGIIYFRMKDFTRAREYLKLSYTEDKGDRGIQSKASLINNIALTFAREGIRDSASVYYQKAIETLKTTTYETYDFKTEKYREHLLNVFRANLAYLDVEEGVFNKAIKAINRELQSGKRESEPSTVFQAYAKIAEIHYLKKDYEIAVVYLDSAQSLIHINEIFDDDKIKVLNLRAKILLATNRQDQADQLFKYAKHYEDSISLVKSTEKTIIASAIYGAHLKEKELQNQRVELDRRNQEIFRKEKLQKLYIIIVSILLISLLIYLRSYSKLKAKKKELEMQKQLVDTSLLEKETLLKEVHHRVKNNLQMVSSLLIKQGAITDNEQVKRLMQDGQNRIKSMAMVHQLLYQTEDFRNINIKDYTELLVNSISGSHQFKGMKISTRIEMAEIATNIDVAVPYGLILNELISNAFEHAFTDGGLGEITIRVEPIHENTYQLTVSDNGKGLPADIEEKMKRSLGLNLIIGLAWQLRGEFTYSNTILGSVFKVRFQSNLKEIE